MDVLTDSSSSSSTHHDQDRKYIHDVFLSFRGADTRNGFTDHLYNALLDAGISTFLDDEEIEIGELLKPELEIAIQSSRASVIVLSKNYAYSTWCLDELVLILEQKRNFNQFVMPIFYQVHPSDVRKQRNSFGDALAYHNKWMEAETDDEKRREKIDLWKRALTDVANLRGQDANGRKETELVKEVITAIGRRLVVPLVNSLPLLIGMDHYIQLISSWLTDGYLHTAADILTVVGMGGIGKTALARYVFQLHSSSFYRSSFIENISKRCDGHLLDLQKQLHGDISKKISSKVDDVSVYTSKIEKALASKTVFLVLDDIDRVQQLDALLGKKGLHPGSKIIITTRDASLTERCALFNSKLHPNHKQILLNGLGDSESLELLCFHAFKSRKPEESYEKVLDMVVKYCHGHPLALTVLGTSLLNRDVAYWEECINCLKKEPHSAIERSLKMSFDVLQFESDKKLFKYIACLFVGTDRDVTETILNACDMNTKSGIKNLIDRNLLSINQNNELAMHPLIQEMGRDLVRQEHLDKPWKRSILWCHEESFQVLKEEKGTENLLGVALDMRKLDKENSFELKTHSLSKMVNLKLLQLNFVQLSGSFKNFTKDLRWLCMHGFPLASIPIDIPMENLVALDMSYSNIVSFDVPYSSPQPHAKRQKELVGSHSKDKSLGSLKILDLSFCKQLCSVGGFQKLPALERLIVKSCISLIELSESVERCVELAHIDLSYCLRLKKLPNSLGNLRKLKTLFLDGCISGESQIEMGNVKAIIPSILKFSMISLPSSLRILSLANNNLSNECFPMDLSSLGMLEELCLDKNPIVSMPNFVRTLPRLERLYMNGCDKMISIEHPPSTLRELSVFSYGRYNPSIRKIKFDPRMYPLEQLMLDRNLFPHSSIEIDGILKIQPIAGVEEKVLNSLGWKNLDCIKESYFKTYSLTERSEESQAQMYYEFGIFSMFYCGDEIPNWISCRSKGPSISFTIPSYPKKLQGLNFFCVETISQDSFVLPLIKISNITKKHTWIYEHYMQRVRLGGKCLSLLSHWMFGPNEMKSGNHITITVSHRPNGDDYYQHTKECGIGFVYEDEVGKNKEEEDVLGYYKSWNHILGGDLSAFQLTTGEYLLDNRTFMRHSWKIDSSCLPFIDDEASYKEEEVRFKAFSQRSLK